MRRLTITASLIDHVRKFLGEDGADFFAAMKRKHGRYDAVYMEFGIPHPVHFREGMQVRNAMRRHADCDGWDAHDFDNAWVRVVELCLSPTLPPMPLVLDVPDELEARTI